MAELLIILGILFIPTIAQIYVSKSYKEYSSLDNAKNISGFEVARKILDNNGLSNIDIVSVKGELTDHYDSSRKVVRLSEKNFNGTSVASLAIAAHECGHAIQDKTGYIMMRIRSLIFPIVNLGTKLSYIIIFVGCILQILNVVYIGIIFTSFGLLFQLVTLPVEFDASKRAKEEIAKLNVANEEDNEGVKTMLTSAALTYVAGVLASALQILRLLLAFGRRD